MRGKTSRKEAVRVTHDAGFFLGSRNHEYRRFVCAVAKLLFLEDLGLKGDITTSLVKSRNGLARATVVAKSGGILSGTDEIEIFLQDAEYLFASAVKCVMHKKNGRSVKKADRIVVFEGKASDLLALERTILNIIGRMSGIATYANRMGKLCKGKVLVAPTRKTFWGMMDKKACHDGGGGTHRINLGDAVLIKDNHIAVEGGVRNILKKGLEAGAGRFVEIEVKDEGMLKDALELYESSGFEGKTPLYVLLDNMSPKRIRESLRVIKTYARCGTVFVEASGGIALDNAAAYAKTGVDIVSSGAMTHSAPWFDVSMTLERL